VADYLDSLVKRGVISASAAQRLTAQRADSGGFGDPNVEEQAGRYDIPRGGEEYPGAMMPVSPPSFADRLQSFGARGNPNVENRVGQTTIRERQHAWKTAPLPIGSDLWNYIIQDMLGTNWTGPLDRKKLPARLIPRGQLPTDIGTEDINRGK
jgi:hypothetical protein